MSASASATPHPIDIVIRRENSTRDFETILLALAGYDLTEPDATGECEAIIRERAFLVDVTEWFTDDCLPTAGLAGFNLRGKWASFEWRIFFDGATNPIEVRNGRLLAWVQVAQTLPSLRVYREHISVHTLRGGGA